MARPLSFRWDEEFVAAIDRARGDVPRSVWVRRAVERQLDGYPITGGPTQETFDAVVADRDRMEDELLALRAVERALEESGAPGGAVVSTSSPAPAEQPVKEWSTLAEHGEVYEQPERRVSPSGPASPRVPSAGDEPVMSDVEREGFRNLTGYPRSRRDVEPFQRGES